MLSLSDLEAAGLLEGIDGEAARQGRLELVRELVEAGFTLDELREADSRNRLAMLLVDRVLEREPARFTSVEVAERSELELELLTRLWRALGLAVTPDEEVAYTDTDLEAAKTVARFRAAGLDDEALVTITQVLGHNMVRLSETVREVVGEAFLQPGASEHAVALRWAQAAEHMAPMLTPLLSYVLGVHLRDQTKGDILSREELTAGRVEGVRNITVCFADLVGFTRLGEQVAPSELGSAERRLTELALLVTTPPVRLVKTIGDAAMLVSPEPQPLVEAALAMVERAEEPGANIPLRVGVASGNAIAQRGDWFGAPVNLASRLTDVARPGSVLVTREVRDSTRDSFSWSFAGSKHFRGVRSEVALYRARALPAASPDPASDH